MSNGTSAGNVLPLTIGVAPFPEGFQGDMDEHAQQFVQLMTAYVEGQFLTGVILPPNSTLPTTNEGMIFMGGIWYYWDTNTHQYLPQTVSQKPAKNYVKNCAYQIAQVPAMSTSFTVPAGTTKTYDLTQVRVVTASVLAIAPDVGPLASGDTDLIPSAMKYSVGPTLVPTLGASDLYCHEHMIEGCDIAMLQGQSTSLSFSVWCNVAGTYSVYLANSGRDRSYTAQFTISSAQLSTWVRIKIPNIPAFPATGTWTYGEGTTGLYIGIVMGVGTALQTSSLNTWNTAFYAGSATNTNLLTVGTNVMKITGLKLEANVAATYLAVPSFEADYHDAIRYYWTSYTYQSTTAGVWAFDAVSNVAATTTGTVVFPRRLCKPPTITFNAASSNTAGSLRNLSTAADVAVTAPPAVQKGFNFNGATTGSAKGDVLAAFVTADARLS